jgi:hypothetical protein
LLSPPADLIIRDLAEMPRTGSGVRDEASFFLELGRVDLAASETLLQNF